ncbi:DUF4145 domain-containing protein [Mucilaginibacter conchicola]|uniref:DUF4145 domain-containing protein n=1 Tax=Mucilaginibacter conchicola TaxID=2303333 RepID=A0A372NM43_9SPHI|nr:DUF4145 domain-containing protein [Mucilaginibacter conchicola]RFZ89918.1 DUF4145 domain-containing protein [Mucilaginibacter conchicola]
MKKEIWRQFTENLPCPSCENGVLKYCGEYIRRETLESRLDNNFGPAGIVSPAARFLETGNLECSTCKEAVIFVRSREEDVRHLDDDGFEIDFIKPLYYFPAPPIINIPLSCAPVISELLKVSFQLFWIDLGSCANKIRTAAECIMDHLQVPKLDTLNARIIELKKTRPTISEHLMAIKWIGNSGSHNINITKDLVLDGYEIMEYVLEQIFDDREKQLSLLVQKINKNKGSSF